MSICKCVLQQTAINDTAMALEIRVKSRHFHISLCTIKVTEKKTNHIQKHWLVHIAVYANAYGHACARVCVHVCECECVRAQVRMSEYVCCVSGEHENSSSAIEKPSMCAQCDQPTAIKQKQTTKSTGDSVSETKSMACLLVCVCVRHVCAYACMCACEITMANITD